MKIQDILRKAVLTVFSTGICFSAITVNAASVNLPGGRAILEDDNLEYVLDGNGQIKTSGTLTVGDTLVAFIDFSKVQRGDNTTFQDLAAGSEELTGISAITLLSNPAPDLFVFGPSPATTAILAPYTAAAGALAVLFEQDPGDFATSCHLANTCEADATNGSNWMTFGIGDADDFWIASGALPGIGIDAIDLSVAATLAATTKFGTANFALSILENFTGFDIEEQVSALSPLFAAGGGDDGLTDVIGSGDILGGAGLTNDFVARSDFDFELVRIPEPGMLMLFGLGLIGLASAKRKKA